MLSTVSYPIEIVQHSSLLVMLAELEMQVRRAYLDGREHRAGGLPAGSRPPAGGTWDGDTLVIDTTLLSRNGRCARGRNPSRRASSSAFTSLKLADIAARPSGFVASVEKPINDDVLVVEMTSANPTLYEGLLQRTSYFQRMADTATRSSTHAAMSIGLSSLRKIECPN